MTTKTLTLPEFADQISAVALRLMMLLELTRLAIENLPNSTDSDVPLALLNGIQEILGKETSKAYELSEAAAKMTAQCAHEIKGA